MKKILYIEKPKNEKGRKKQNMKVEKLEFLGLTAALLRLGFAFLGLFLLHKAVPI